MLGKLGTEPLVAVCMNPSDLDKFNLNLAEDNVQIILEFLLEYNITEVWGAWGAWGDLGQPSLIEGRDMRLYGLKNKNIRVYSFAPLTNSKQPVHPLNRRVKQSFSLTGKKYLDF